MAIFWWIFNLLLKPNDSILWTFSLSIIKIDSQFMQPFKRFEEKHLDKSKKYAKHKKRKICKDVWHNKNCNSPSTKGTHHIHLTFVPHQSLSSSFHHISFPTDCGILDMSCQLDHSLFQLCVIKHFRFMNLNNSNICKLWLGGILQF